jgi:TonB family protein
LRAKDTVSTDQDSRAVIKFNSGLRVELEPNSLIIVDDFGSGPGQLELTFLQGGAKILDQGKGPKLNLSGADMKKKEVPTAKIDFNQLFNSQENVGLEDKEEKAKKKTQAKNAKEVLPESYIASIIKNQKNFLYRCYAQHLRLNPDARGRIDTSITIEPDGTVSSCRVIGSTIPDPTLQQCVVSTLARARFRSFNGDPMIVTYPIHFD